jgi:K(+)-stimulated pyrophosphate-energized sodium pump
VVITEYYTGTNFRPVRSWPSLGLGHGTNVIQGLAVSLEATALPALVIIVGIIATYQLAGLFGIAIATTTMLGVAGMIVALDAFGPVTDNAGGIAEMAGLPRKCVTPPTPWTPWATPPRPSPRAMPSVRRASARWCSSRPIRRDLQYFAAEPCRYPFFANIGTSSPST